MPTRNQDLWVNGLVLVCTVGMLVGSKTWGRTTGNVSRSFSLRVSPPGVMFAIWGLIYLGLIITALYSVLGPGWTHRMKVLFSVGCILNALWLYIFGFGTKLSNLVCCLVLISLAVVNQKLWFETLKISTGTHWDLVNSNILAFYQGWLVVASNLNAGIVLVYVFGLSKNTQAILFWLMAPLSVTYMVLLNLEAPNGFRSNIAMYVSALYGLTGAMISFMRGEETTSNYKGSLTKDE